MSRRQRLGSARALPPTSRSHLASDSLGFDEREFGALVLVAAIFLLPAMFVFALVFFDLAFVA